jgi:release factor glutamine methyltransferase
MPDSALTVAQALRSAAAALAALSSTARLDAELLLADVLQWPRSRVLAEYAQLLSPQQQAVFDALIARRMQREPIAYLLGRREFYGLEFSVDRRVLIPRPETELLVERALAFAAARPGRRLRIADIGTGSGAIAVALAVHLPQAAIIAGDISHDALAVAAVNAARHQVSERISLRRGDLLDVIDAPVDLLISNPPYTLINDIEPGVAAYEPHLALDGGPDGLAFYRRLLAGAAAVLQPDGALLFEIGAWQGRDLLRMTAAALPHATLQILPDLAGLDRVVEARHDSVISTTSRC